MPRPRSGSGVRGFRGTARRIAVAASLACLVGVANSQAADATDHRSSRFVSGELIVAFGESSSAAERREALATVDAEASTPLPLTRTKLVELEGGAVRRSAGELEALPGVRYAQPNYYRHAARIPNDPLFPSLWGLQNTGQSVGGFQGPPDADIDAPEAWDIETGSSATTVAVVDSGIELSHPDLAANVWTNPGEVVNGADDDANGKVDDVNGWDFIDTDPTPNDAIAHGTHVAGTVGAVGDNGVGVTGVAWDVSLMAVRVLGDDGFGTDAEIATGLDYAAKEGARVVNASLGGADPAPALDSAIAAHPETLYVVAAGNSHLNNDSKPFYPCNAPTENLICVAATDRSDALAFFSNFGAQSVDLAAPGIAVLSTIPGGGYGLSQGTSMATPQVSGAAALALSRNPSLSVAKLRAALLGSVDQRTALVGKVASGGRLNAAGLLARVNPPPETEITAGPAGATANPTPTFRFSSSASGASFECSVDGAAFGPCSGAQRHTTPRLGDGAHSFRVRARDTDGSADPSPAERRFTVDTRAPDTRIDDGPRRRSRDRTPAFRFSSPEPSAGFECRLDRREWRRCSSPQRYRVSRRHHVFEVRAEDEVGNTDPAPARYGFEVKG